MESPKLYSVKFVVDENPYCFWELNLPEKNKEFLDGIELDYFPYLAARQRDVLGTEDEQKAALAIRMTYGQALETFFALLFATLQAPHCVYGWLIKYKNADLDSLVNKLIKHQPILTNFFGNRFVEWDAVSELILSKLVFSDKEQEKIIKQTFSKLWKHFAFEYSGEQRKQEYNSIKHGLRVKPGGFHISFAPEKQPGIAANSSEMMLLGKSDFGSSFPIAEKICQEKYQFTTTTQHLNWNPEYLLSAIEALSSSINNVVSFLKLINGVDSKEVGFMLPEDEKIYDDLIKSCASVGVWSMTGFHYRIDENQIKPASKEEILGIYMASNNKNRN